MLLVMTVYRNYLSDFQVSVEPLSCLFVWAFFLNTRRSPVWRITGSLNILLFCSTYGEHNGTQKLLVYESKTDISMHLCSPVELRATVSTVCSRV